MSIANDIFLFVHVEVEKSYTNQIVRHVFEQVVNILLEKEKKLLCSCFSYCLNIFNPFPNKPWFLRVCITSLLKTLWEKEKLLVTSNFSFSQSVFYHILRSFCHFHQISNCRLETFWVWKSLKFAVWERVKKLFLRYHKSHQLLKILRRQYL